MSAAAMRFDVAQIRSRTRRSMAASGLVHALLFLWIAVLPHPDEDAEALTEITLVMPEDLAPAGSRGGPAASAPARASLPATSTPDERFPRRATSAEVTPEPQSDQVAQDRLNQRLLAMQGEAVSRAPGAVISPAAAATSRAAWGAAAGPGTGSGAASSGPLALSRGGATSGSPLDLARGPAGRGAAPALPPTSLPIDRSAGSAPARGGETSARRTIAGAVVAGPIADRDVLHMVRPTYPEWAKREAVEGSVTLYFVVRPDGTVKENVVIQKTAGFQEFDENARLALRDWRFEALRAGRTEEQWGTITFHFRLRDAG